MPETSRIYHGGNLHGASFAIDASAITGDHKILIDGSDTTAGYLSSKIVAGSGISFTIQNPGANENILISNSGILSIASVGAGTGIILKGVVAGAASIKSLIAGSGISITNNTDDITLAATSTDSFKVKVSATDTTEDYLLSKICDCGGLHKIQGVPAGNEVLLLTVNSYFYDTFQKLKPFWENTPVLTSADWSVSVGNYLLGGAENNTYDSFRVGIEGDFDYLMKFSLQSAAQCGMQFIGNSVTAQFLRETSPSNRLRVIVTGDSDVTVAYATTTFWLRTKRRGDVLYFYYRANDTDTWTLLTSTTKVMLDMVTAYLRSANTCRINPVILYDNQFPERLASDAPKVVTLTDAAPIVVDARRGNVFTFTMTNSRQLQNPLNPIDGQKIIFRIKQGGAGSYALTYDTKYRFATSLPSPVLSTAVGSTDYLGFIYNLTDDKWDFIAFVQGFT